MKQSTDPVRLHDSRWKAVLARDASRDGTFVTAVKTTGIYCRPSCPARHPRPQNVEFYARPEQAEAAGFRACKRCKPRQAGVPGLEWVREVCRHIEANLEEPVTLEQLAAHVRRSPFHLLRAFRKATGVTPRQYADALRMRRFRAGARAGGSITEAIYGAGFGSGSRLYERAPQQLGMSPRRYQRGGIGMSIGYVVSPCALGKVLVAATQRGICMVSLGSNGTALEAALKNEYPSATITRDAAGMHEWLAGVLAQLKGRAPDVRLPVDVQSTAFQRRVWEELRKIPRGATSTYSEVARRIGAPGAARAVARACATNPVAVVIPCHRVVPAGAGGGYRWGIERKKALLEAEAGARAGAAGAAVRRRARRKPGAAASRSRA